MTEPLEPDARAALDELALLLRPPGQGIHTISTGRVEARAATAAYLGTTGTDDRVSTPWIDTVAASLEGAPLALLGVPSDAGAGLVRGAAHGPRGIRAALGRAPCLDLGDVLCVPHYLDEGSLSEPARHRTQDALYPDVPTVRRRDLPVSPLGMTRRAIELLGRLAPTLRLLVLGGDHSITWPVLDAMLDADPARNADVGIVHFDAHTDLLPERLGVPICFATWAWHANERIGRGRRLVQLGIRASARSRDEWESTLDVVQRWGDTDLAPDALGAWVVDHLRAHRVRRVYVSNDIDGTDARWAAACGTPEPGGLTPAHVLAVLSALRAAEDLTPLGADLVEVAPGLSLDVAASERTCAIAADYARATLAWLSRTGE